MKRVPLSESVAIAVAERLGQGWVGHQWTDVSGWESGRGHHQGTGTGYGITPGSGNGPSGWGARDPYSTTADYHTL